MSQTWTDNCYDVGHVIATDMTAIENNMACLKSMFSGASAPSDPVAGTGWFDTTKKLPKVRNNANSAWLGIMAADSSHKIWVYRNTAPDGWAIDSSVTDRVLALKGGSDAYNVSGGGTAGTWTQPDHTLTASECAGGGSVTDSDGNQVISVKTDTSAGSAVAYFASVANDSYEHPNPVNGGPTNFPFANRDGKLSYLGSDGNTHYVGTYRTYTVTGSATAHNHGTTYRPAAAVGTLQYMDI
jgi:hypothetical protein